MTPLTQETPQLVLDEAGAARAWNWVLARQGLADGRPLSSAAEIADATLGLHAARLPSPYAIVAARASDPAVAGSLFTAPVRASLLTVRCMRKTLHALPLPLASAAHAATLRFRDRDAQRAVYNAGYPAGATEAMICELGALLRDGPRPHRTIEALLSAAGREVQAARLAVKVAWERGVIAYVNATGSWDREARTFALTASAYPGLDLSLTREQAVTALVTAYFHRYGPATVRDAAWWSGLSATDVTAALRRGQRPLVTVAAPWSARPCLMFADVAAEGASYQEAARGATARARGLRPQGLPRNPRPLPRRPAAAARVQPDRRSAARSHCQRGSRGHMVMGQPQPEHRSTHAARKGDPSRPPPGTRTRCGADRHAPRRPQSRLPSRQVIVIG